MTLGPAAVQVHGYVGPKLGRDRREGRGRKYLVDGASEKGQRFERAWTGEQFVVAGKRVGQRPQRRNGREEIAEAERP
jgi:hypothetical protein